MRRIAIAAVCAGVLLLAGCAGSSDESKALSTCESLLEVEYPGMELDTSDLVVESFTDALFEAGITDERDNSKTVYAVSGDTIISEGSIDNRVTTICQVTVEDGEVTDSNLTAS